MTVAFHGVEHGTLFDVLRDGLLREHTAWAKEGRFWHLSFSDRASIAAEYGIVVQVDLAGIELSEEGFVNGEMRLHEDIKPSRLAVLDPQPSVDRANFSDPAHYPHGNHPTCLRLRCWETCRP
jgi:hypothetical protein